MARLPHFMRKVLRVEFKATAVSTAIGFVWIVGGLFLAAIVLVILGFDPKTLPSNTGGTAFAAVLFLFWFGGGVVMMYWSARRYRRRHGLRCPHCGHQFLGKRRELTSLLRETCPKCVGTLSSPTSP